MENMKDVATYICRRYEQQYGVSIDEMKLHKLMYFAQRESLIQTGEPLFPDTFYGWKYGPVLKELRRLFSASALVGDVDENLCSRIAKIMDAVFCQYATKDSWSLSRLTHGEYSWQRSREDVPESSNSDNPIRIEDIKIDAARIWERRLLLNQMNFSEEG